MSREGNEMSVTRSLSSEIAIERPYSGAHRKPSWFFSSTRTSLTRTVSAMASIFYGTPSSLPSDYAILSRYANTDEPVDDYHEIAESTDTLDGAVPITGRTATRRSSFPSPYLRPLQPKLPEPFGSRASAPDEYSPLLVPRIEEEVVPTADPVHQSSAKVYRDEFRILLKYTLPVFRYASSLVHCL